MRLFLSSLGTHPAEDVDNDTLVWNKNRLGAKRISALTWIVMSCIEMLGTVAVGTVLALGLARSPPQSRFHQASHPYQLISLWNYLETCDKTTWHSWCEKMSGGPHLPWI